jgi:DDE family transposase
MTTIGIEELFLSIYVLTDDWYKRKGQFMVGRTVGQRPSFSDSEVLTLMLTIDFFEFTSERRYISFMRANYLKLFPELLTQSQYNRRANRLRYLLNERRKALAQELGVNFETHFLLDTTPVIAVGYRRDKSQSAFREAAAYGPCAARRMTDWGYKLVMLTSLAGIPYAFDLVPADTDERVAADEVLDSLPVASNGWADKGFIKAAWQADWAQQGIHSWTQKRENQLDQNPPAFDHLLNQVREPIETAYDRLKEGGRSIEHTLAHTIKGISAAIPNLTSTACQCMSQASSK